MTDKTPWADDARAIARGIFPNDGEMQDDLAQRIDDLVGKMVVEGIAVSLGMLGGSQSGALALCDKLGKAAKEKLAGKEH